MSDVTITIDLSDSNLPCTQPGLFTGITKGRTLRDSFHLDVEDFKSTGMIDVRIPSGAIITYSYFKGLMENSVIHLKTADNFYKKYTFGTEDQIIKQLVSSWVARMFIELNTCKRVL